MNPVAVSSMQSRRGITLGTTGESIGALVGGSTTG